MANKGKLVKHTNQSVMDLYGKYRQTGKTHKSISYGPNMENKGKLIKHTNQSVMDLIWQIKANRKNTQINQLWT